MAVSIKFTKFDNTPWGFRLAGGSDFPQPLTVIKVAEESLAECMGLKVGDVVVRLNDQPISSLTHGQAHEELVRAGNNFVLGVQRGEDSLKAVEALSEENIVPYKIPLADLPPVFPEVILKEETVIERHEETNLEAKPADEEVKPEVEPLPDKPKDANSEIVPNQNLTDDEIAQLILEEEELLNDKGVLGVNFKKLRPRATVLKQSKVIEELQSIATAEPPLVEQLKRTSVFLQKPQRPIPVPRKKEEEEAETEVESYRVVIKKQKKRSVTDRLLEKGLLRPGDASTPEPPTPEVNMESNEIGTRIEENDAPTVSSGSLEDDPSTEQMETRSACSVASVLFPEPGDLSGSSVGIEAEDPTNSSPSVSIAASRSSEGGEDLAACPRRGSAKRKVKSYCSRGHYFRRCIFGRRGDGKRAIKAKSTFRVERDLGNGAGARSGVVNIAEKPEEPRRGSVVASPRSRIRARYLETYLKREDNWMRRMLDALFEKPGSFSSSKLFDRLTSGKGISSRRTRYAEKILLRSVEFVAARLRLDILKKLESPTVPIAAVSRSRFGKRLRFKGLYFQRIFWRNVARLASYFRVIGSGRDIRDRRRSSSAMIRTKGRYLETYLLGNAFFDLHDLRARFTVDPSVVSSKRKLFSRTHYVERILKMHFESLGLIVKYIRGEILRGSVAPGCSSLNESRGEGRSVSSTKDVLSDFVRSSRDFVATEVFHRGCRRPSTSRGSVSAGVTDHPAASGRSLLDRFAAKFGRQSTDRTIDDKKIVQDDDRDNGRRLSFVPTVLYEGFTNRIGVDFTRLVAYAFVPCTTVILLYMYK